MAEGRRIGRIVWIPLILIGLVAGGALALKAIFTEERLREEVARAGQRALGAPVHIGGAEFALLPPAVVLEDVRVDGVGPGDPPLLELQGGLVTLEWAPLLRGRLVVRELRLQGPRLSLRQDEHGVVLPGPLAASPGAATPAPSSPAVAPRSTVISRFEIADGSLSLTGATPEDAVTVNGLDLAARVEMTEGNDRLRAEGEIHLDKLDVGALAPYRPTLERLAPTLAFSVDYRISRGTLDMSALRLVAGPLDLAGTGRLDGLPAAPRLVLDVQPSSVSLEELLPLIPPAMIPEGRSPRAKGPASLAAHVDGPLGDPASPPSFRLQIGFEGAELGMEGFPLGLTQVKGDVAVADTAVTLSGLTATLGTGTLAVDGRIASPTAPDSGSMDLDVKAAMDLALFQEAGFVPQGTEVGGRLDADVHVAARGADPAATRLSGTVALADGRMKSPDLAVPLHGLTGRVELSGSSAVLHEIRGALGSSSFRGSGRVDDVLAKEPRITLTGQCPRLDLVELAPPPDSAAAAASASGAGGAAAPLPDLIPPLAPIRAHLELAVDSLLAIDTALSGTKLTADLADSTAKVQAAIARAAFSKGAVTLADVTGSGTIRGGRFDGVFHAPRGEAYRLPLGAVDGTLGVAGRQVEVKDVTAGLFTGRIEGNAHVDLADPLSPEFRIDSQAKGLEANDFVSALTPARDVLHGKLDLSSHFTGKGLEPLAIAQSLVAEGTLDAKGGRLSHGPHTQAIWNALKLDEKKAIDFRELVAPFSIRGGQLHTENLEIASSEATWRATGGLGFDGKLDFDVEVELGDALASEFRRRAGSDVARLLQGSGGKITLDLHLAGPATGPSVTVDTSKLAARAAENAREQLKGKLQSSGSKLLGKLGLGSGTDSTAAADSAKADSAAAPAPPKLEDALKGLLKRK